MVIELFGGLLGCWLGLMLAQALELVMVKGSSCPCALDTRSAGLNARRGAWLYGDYINELSGVHDPVTCAQSPGCNKEQRDPLQPRFHSWRLS